MFRFHPNLCRVFSKSFSTSNAARLTAQGERLILGIESSCDDSCVALLSGPRSYTASSFASTSKYTLDDVQSDSQSSQGPRERARAKVLVSKVLRQDHSQTQGIHPLLAQHYHMAAMPLAIKQCLAEGGISSDGREIDGIAVTRGPGMPGCLSVGLTTAKTLAAAWRKPLIPVHHMEAHALTPFLTEHRAAKRPLAFPFLTLLLSGGHTMLVLASGVGCYKILAATSDDSIGDAFDKAAKCLAIPTDWLKQSPGASLEAFAAQAPPMGVKGALPPFALPFRGKTEFSYSGLKSGFKRRLEEAVAAAGCGSVEELPTSTRQLYAQAFQQAAFAQVEDKIGLVLAAPQGNGENIGKVRGVVRPQEWERAAGLDDCKHLVVSGGVAANVELRRRLKMIWKEEDGRELLFPPLEYCVDNAAMIAHMGLLLYDSTMRSRVEEGGFEILPMGKWSMETLVAPL